jgi:hypothetical protein
MFEFVGSTLIPSEVLECDAQVNAAYPNLRIAYQPTEQRAEHSADKPFALVDQLGGFIIKELSEEMARNTTFLMRWLWENDSTRHGEKSLYNKFIDDKAKAEEKRKKEHREHLMERAEVAHAVASSPLHTYRINGRKLGADNEFPTLGIQ